MSNARKENARRDSVQITIRYQELDSSGALLLIVMS